MKRPRAIVPVLPTVITLGNLVFGFLAMAKTIDALSTSGGTGPLDPAFGAKIEMAGWFVVLAMVCDALDGRVARLTNQTSEFGSMLDSLADVVTFGVTPALMAKVVYEHTKNSLDQPFSSPFVTALCVLYLIGAVLRLARFTIATDQDEASHHTFEGLPSPAAAGMVITTCIFAFGGRHELGMDTATADTMATWMLRALPITACLLGILMISRMPYVHVFQRYVGHRQRPATFAWLVLVVWALIAFKEQALFLAAAVYVLGGLVLGIRARFTGRPVTESLPAPLGVVDEMEGEADERSQPSAGSGYGSDPAEFRR